jgi:plasmid stabilization system protein ParE
MKLFITKKAERNYNKIKEYITDEFGDRVAEAFEQKTVDFFDLLVEYPEMGSLEFIDKNIRGFQLAKQTRVFYRIKNDKIIILTFFHVRQSPSRKFQ